MSMFADCKLEFNGEEPVTIVNGDINNNGNNNNNGNGMQTVSGDVAAAVSNTTNGEGGAAPAVSTTAIAQDRVDAKDDSKDNSQDNSNSNSNSNANANANANANSNANANANNTGLSNNRFMPYVPVNQPHHRRRRASTGNLGDERDFLFVRDTMASGITADILTMERTAGLGYGPSRGSATYTMTRDDIARRVQSGLLNEAFLRFYDKNQNGN